MIHIYPLLCLATRSLEYTVTIWASVTPRNKSLLLPLPSACVLAVSALSPLCCVLSPPPPSC